MKQVCSICGKKFELGWKRMTCAAPECYQAQRQITRQSKPKNPLGNGEDLTGRKFHRLEVLEPVGSHRGNLFWKCRCDCGKITNVAAFRLKNGTTKSCGCLHKESMLRAAKIATEKDAVYGTHPGNLCTGKLRSNNTSGVTGVWYHKQSGKWQARIKFKKQTYYLGSHETIEEATRVRKVAEEKMHGELLEVFGVVQRT